MSYETVLFEKRNDFAYITLNRPERANSMTPQLTRELNAVIDEIEADSTIRIVLITGAGDRHFCAGGDLKNTDGIPGSANWRTAWGSRRDAHARLEQLDQPVIAVINGAAMGGGCELALACDFRFMAEEAKIGLPEIRFGALPTGGTTQRLPRMVGLARAKELVLTGKHLTAKEALDIGLVTAVAPRATLMDRAEEFARELAQYAAYALRTGKLVLQRALDVDLATGLAYSREMFWTMATPEEFQEAQRQAMSRSDTYKNIFNKAD